MAYDKTLTINEWTPPAPQEGGFVIGKEPIWSENTGRVASGLMVGDIIAIKTTLEITWNKLLQDDLTELNKAVCNSSKPFFDVTYCDETGTKSTKTFYCSPNSYTRKHYTKDSIKYTDVSIRLIER